LNRQQSAPGSTTPPRGVPALEMSVITPSFNMLGYLKRCCASVTDQMDPPLEHIVVDGGSTDGTVEWLDSQPRIISIVGRDSGMYDAINKGFQASSGGILSYLSCDEQYLPGTLEFVRAYFEAHPEVDVVFGDTLVTRPDGSLLCFRKAYKPVWLFIAAGDLYVFPSSMFLQRRVIDSGDLFDASFKDVGDAEFVVRLLRRGYHVATTRRYLSTFTLTGSNRSQNPAVYKESQRLQQMMPGWVFRLRLPINVVRLLFKFASGAYFERSPLRYAIYASATDPQRTTFENHAPSARWRLA
jgi:glycosyltransferase involved in cell wall biosynthesis